MNGIERGRKIGEGKEQRIMSWQGLRVKAKQEISLVGYIGRLVAYIAK